MKVLARDHIHCSFAYKLVCVHERFSKPDVLYRGKNLAYKLTKFLKSMNTVKK